MQGPIRSGSVSVDEAIAAVTHEGAGAVVTFVGTVRGAGGGRRVTLLEYDAYPRMAAEEMSRILCAVEAEIPGARVFAAHRVGALRVGDVAVVCAASAPHREEAFRACRLVIDRVKASVPIWKREHDERGARWVGWDEGTTGSGA